MANRTKINHYKTLGVSEHASADEIKRAYRSKARETHPDKGGNSAEFATVAEAYEVLTDPERKLLYDATGADEQKPVESEARQLLAQLFAKHVLATKPGKVLKAIQADLDGFARVFKQQTVEFKSQLEKLEARRLNISTTDTVNFAQIVIDNEIKNLKLALIEIDHKVEVRSLLLKMLETYTEETEISEPEMVTIEFMGNYVGGGFK